MTDRGVTQPQRLVLGPFNRVEGDLEVALTVQDGRVQAAHVSSPLYRGFERMLAGRDPRDALVITPRICGICSISQSAAAARALADAMGLQPTPQGARVAALIHAAENVADHLTHFHLFFMPDFARPDYDGRSWHPRAVERFTASDVFRRFDLDVGKAPVFRLDECQPLAVRCPDETADLRRR